MLFSFAAGAFAMGILFLSIGWLVSNGTDWRNAVSQGNGVGEESGTSIDDSACSYADAVRRAAPAVVSVYGSRATARQSDSTRPHPSTTWAPMPDQGKHGQTSLGSGVLVSDSGLLLTNRHVIAGADRIDAELSDGRLLRVELLGVDVETDLAVLRAADPDLPAIAIGNPEALQVGDVVMAIGNPFGIGQTVSLGIVSATGRGDLGITGIEHFIQTDAAINPGNSGGPLIDAHGRLIGINTAILSESGLSEGIGFAIPASIALRVAREIEAKGKIERGWLGIAGRDLTPRLVDRYGLRASHGVLITSVSEHSPAASAGLRAGDVLTSISGRVLHGTHDLREAIGRAGPAAQIQLQIWRGSEQRSTSVTTAARPANSSPLTTDPTGSSRQTRNVPSNCSKVDGRNESCWVRGRLDANR